MALSSDCQMLQSKRLLEFFARVVQAGTDDYSEVVTVRGVIRDKTTTAVVEYKKHKMILGGQSNWFAAACRNHAFQEGATGVITIPLTEEPDFSEDADDFEAFRCMMHFFDHADYCLPGDKPYVEDSPYTDESLLLHAKVYGLAEKYDVTGLREASSQCFTRDLDLLWPCAKLGSVVQVVNQSVAPEVDGLKQILANKIADKWSELKTKTDTKDALTEFQDFSFRMTDTFESKARDPSGGGGHNREPYRNPWGPCEPYRNQFGDSGSSTQVVHAPPSSIFGRQAPHATSRPGGSLFGPSSNNQSSGSRPYALCDRTSQGTSLYAPLPAGTAGGSLFGSVPPRSESATGETAGSRPGGLFGGSL